MGTFQAKCEVQSLSGKGEIKTVNLAIQSRIMPAIEEKKKKANQATVVKKMRDYSNEPAFKKKEEKAKAFLKEHGLPEAFTKKKK